MHTTASSLTQTVGASASPAASAQPSPSVPSPSNPAAARAAELFQREVYLATQRNSYEAAQKAAMAGSYPSLAERRQRRLEEITATAAAAAASSGGSASPGPEIPVASLVPYPLGPTDPPSRVTPVHESTSILPPTAPILKPSSPARWTSSLSLTLSPGSTLKAVSFAQQLEAVRNIPSRGSSYADDELEQLGSSEQSNTTSSSKLTRKTPRPKKKKIKKPHRSTYDDYDSSSISDRTPRHSHNSHSTRRKYTTDIEDEESNEDEEHQSPLTAQLLAAAAQITLEPNEIPPLRAASPSVGQAPSPLRAPRSSKPSSTSALIESPAKLSPTLTAAILEASEQADVAYAAEQMQNANTDSSASSLLMPSRLVELQQNRTALFARVASRRTASTSSSSTSSSVSSLLSAGSASSSSSSGSGSSGSISFASSQSSSTAHSPVISPALAPTRTTATVTLSHARYASQGYKQRSPVDTSAAGGRYMTSPAAISVNSSATRELQRVMPASHTRPGAHNAFAAAPPTSLPPPALTLAVPTSASADDTLSALSANPTGKHTPSPPRADASPRGGNRTQQLQQQQRGGAPGDNVAARSPRGAARLLRVTATSPAQTRHAPRVAAVRGGSGTSGADAWLEQHARECADKQARLPQHARVSSEAPSAPRSSFLFPSPAIASAPLMSRSPKQGYAVSGPQGGFAMGIVGRGAAGSASVVRGSSTGTTGWTPVAVASGTAPFAASSSSHQPEVRSRSNLPSPRGAGSAASAASATAAPRPTSSLGLQNSSSCYVSPSHPQPKPSSKRLSGQLTVGAAAPAPSGSVSRSLAR